MSKFAWKLRLVVLGEELKVALRMSANGAKFGSFLTNHDVATVGALPDAVALAGEYYAVLNVLEQLAITLLVMLFDGTDHFKLGSNLFKTFFAGFLGEGGVHIGPLVVFAGSGISKIFGSGRNGTAMEVLEPNFGVFLFVLGRFGKDIGYLNVAILIGLRRIVLVFGVSLRFAGKSGSQILFGLSAFQFFHCLE